MTNDSLSSNSARPTLTRQLATDLNSAVVACACLCSLFYAAIEARQQFANEMRPADLVTTRSICQSADGQLRVVGIGSAGFACESVAGERTMALELLRHPFDGHLYAFNLLASHNNKPIWQRWSPSISRWDPSDQGTWLTLAHLARGLFPIIFSGFMISLGSCGLRRLRRWLRGAACTLGSACVAAILLCFVPIAWHTAPIVAAAFDRNGDRLATVSLRGPDSVICLWETSTGEGLSETEFANAHFNAVEFAANGTELTVTNAGDETVFVPAPLPNLR